MLTGKFCSTGTVLASDIAMKMARFRAHSSPHAVLWKKRKMGRLVKAFSKDDNGEGSQSDEAQFLREAGALAARIQQELQAEANVSGNEQSSDATPSERSGREFRADEPNSASSNGRQLGRGVYSELDDEWTRMSDGSAAGEATPDGLRIFVGADEPANSSAESSDVNASAEEIRRELMEELAQEQTRWTERHAMQVRSIEEQARQLAQVDAEVELREQELDRRERELDAKARELAAAAETEVRSRISQDWESTQKEMERLASEVRVHAKRASQYEAELAETRREHAVELDALRSKLNQHDDSRTDRAKSVIEECDQRMAELTAQRAAWQTEQSRRREELARERLEQRDETRQQRDAQMAELQTLREEFEKERDSTTARLERERREWSEKFTREQDELLDLKQAVENEVKEVRAGIAREKAEWESHQDHMRAALREEQASAQQLLNARMADAERMKNEQSSAFESLRKEFESERAEWHRERGQEAAILQAERNELATEADRLRAERSLIEADRQKLAAEFERKRADHDQRLRESWRSHQASLQQAEQESANRQRVLEENLQQQQNELASRTQQVEHEIRTARELSARQIAQEKERFTQTCATHEAELERARAELNIQRQQLEREKMDFADELARSRQQTEKERNAIRNSLSQMDAQLRVAATSLLPTLATGPAPLEVARVEKAARPEETVEEPDDFESGVVSETPVEVEPVEVSEVADAVVETEELGVESEESLVETDDEDTQPTAVWEPGKEATLAESRSSDLIHRFDAPAEEVGVFGLSNKPRIATHGVLAQATADARAAEIVYDESGSQTEWVGVVETRSDEDSVGEEAAASGEQVEGRRQALESYRSKLSSLQNQLRQLSSPSADDTDIS